MTQDVEELPSELTRALFQLGGRKLVFVEGETDVAVLDVWFKERKADILFYPSIGFGAVLERLEQVERLRPDVNAYGIRDHDLLSDADVQDALNDASARLFILTRYCLENYLLEPQALFDEMAMFLDKKCPVANAEQVENELLRLSHGLHVLMAANWVLIDHAQKVLPKGFNQTGFAQLAPILAKTLSCSVEAAETLLTEKMERIHPALQVLETAHTRINGKYLLHDFYLYIVGVKGGLSPGHLFNLLVRRIKETVGIHTDIRFIVEKRILGDP